MNNLADKAIKHTPNGIFAFGDVINWYPNATRAAIYGQIQRALKSGSVIQIRRGLYHLSREVFPNLVSSEVLANLIYGPSYISFESALRYHDWIPESVPNCLCVTNLRPREFETVHGKFSYVMVKQSPMMAGVLNIDDGQGPFFMATPLKALADMVASRGLDWTDCRPLVESLRIEPDELEGLTVEDFEMLDGVYYSKRARDFLAGIRRELQV